MVVIIINKRDTGAQKTGATPVYRNEDFINKHRQNIIAYIDSLSMY